MLPIQVVLALCSAVLTKCASSGLQQHSYSVVVDRAGVMRREHTSLQVSPPGGSFISTMQKLTIPQTLQYTAQEGKVPKLPADIIRHLPDDLRALGVATFGSESELTSFLKQLLVPQVVHIIGHNVSLVESSHDDAVWRLPTGDEYGITSINNESGTIVDVGANLGDTAIISALIHPKLQVLALEPVPSTYFLARLNLRLNNVPELSESDLGGAINSRKGGVLLLNRALTPDGRDVPIQYGDSTMEAIVSRSAMNPTNAAYHVAHVKSLNLGNYLTSHQATPVRLLKMDCEGCEFDSIPAMASFFVNKTNVERFAGEIHVDEKNTKSFNSYLTMRGHAQVGDDQVAAMMNVLDKRGCKLHVESGVFTKC